MDITNIKNIYENYIYDLLFFLKKFFLFNKFLKKYFNLNSLNKRIEQNNIKTKKKILLDFSNINIYLNKFLRSENQIKKNITKKRFDNIKYKY